MINYIKGDATIPHGSGKKIIVHVCNDAGGWGAGFVLAISKRWRDPETVYREAANKGQLKLGEIQVVQVKSDLYVVNMIAQHKYYNELHNPQPLKEEALDVCLTKVAKLALAENASVHMPRIGCGLARGDWTKISEIIIHTLCEKNVSVYVYDL